MSHIFVPQCAVLLIICLSFLGCGEANTTPQNAYEGDMPGECNNGADDDRDGAMIVTTKIVQAHRFARWSQRLTPARVIQSIQVPPALVAQQVRWLSRPRWNRGVLVVLAALVTTIMTTDAPATKLGVKSGPRSSPSVALAVTNKEASTPLTWCFFHIIARWQTHNLPQINSVTTRMHDGIPLILLKPTGRHPDGHAGGQLLIEGSDEYNRLNEFVGRILDEINDCGRPLTPLPDSEDACETLEPGRRLLRRLSHVEYQRTIQDLLNVNIDAKGAFVADTIDHGFENHPERLDVTGLLADQYRVMAESISETVDIERLLPCAITDGDI